MSQSYNYVGALCRVTTLGRHLQLSINRRKIGEVLA